MGFEPTTFRLEVQHARYCHIRDLDPLMITLKTDIRLTYRNKFETWQIKKSVLKVRKKTSTLVKQQ